MMSQSKGTPIGYYTIDQTGTYSSPSQMVRDRSVAGIQAIFKASHLYVGELVNGTLRCKQVKDTDKTQYLNGDSVVYTSTNDLFMKLPQFWWKCEDIDNNADIVKLSFSMEDPEDSSWHEWNGNTFIGVYKGYISDSKLYSHSGVTPTRTQSYNTFNTAATNRGNGYSMVTYESHRIMALLGYGILGTLNAQAAIGKGNTTQGKVTGYCDYLGMNNGTDKKSINFWGIENWWGDCYEVMKNVKSSSSASVANVYNLDGTLNRSVNTVSSGSTNAIPAKMVLGTEADLFMKLSGGTSTSSYYSDIFRISGANRFYTRSCYGSSDNGGLSAIYTILSSNTATSSYCGCRLEYNGNYEIIS